MLNRYLEGLVKQAESEETLDRLTISELAKLAGLKLAAHTCDKCGGSMTKSGDMMKCGCGFTKTALVMPAGIGKAVGAGMNLLKAHPRLATAAGAGLAGAGIGAVAGGPGHRLSGAMTGGALGAAGGAFAPEIGKGVTKLKSMATPGGTPTAPAVKGMLPKPDIMQSGAKIASVKTAGLKQLAPLMEDATDVAIRLTGKSTPHEQPPSHEELQARLNKITGEDHAPQLHLPKTAGLKDMGKKVVEHVKGMKGTYQAARKPKGLFGGGGGKGRWAAAMHTAKKYPGTSAAVPSVGLAAGGAAVLHHKKKESSVQLVEVGDAVGRLLAKTAALPPNELSDLLKGVGRGLTTAVGAGTGAVTGGAVGAGVGAARAEKGHRWGGALRGGLAGGALGGVGGAALGQPEVLSRVVPHQFNSNRAVRTAAKWGPGVGLAGLGAAGGMAAGRAGHKEASASRVLARLGPTMGR